MGDLTPRELLEKMRSANQPLSEVTIDRVGGKNQIEEGYGGIVEKIINKKLKKVPRRFRKFLRKCLHPYWNARYHKAGEAKNELDEIIDEMNTRKAISKHFRKWAPTLTVSAAVLGVLLYGVVNQATLGPGVPEVRIRDKVYLGDLEEEPLIFKRDKYLDLPEAVIGLPSSIEQKLRQATKNRSAALLICAYYKAFKHFGAIHGINLVTDAQWGIYAAYTTPAEKRDVAWRNDDKMLAIARSIEYAIVKTPEIDGTRNLEDVCTTARIGLEKLNEARQIADSFKFRDYVRAKYPTGERVISEKEEKAILQWLAYIN